MHVISVVGSLASVSGWVFGQETIYHLLCVIYRFRQSFQENPEKIS